MRRQAGILQMIMCVVELHAHVVIPKNGIAFPAGLPEHAWHIFL
jgi:hypothetical protein